VAGLLADGVRSIVNPAALVEAKTATETPAVVEPTEAPEPAGLFTEAELPAVEEIERAALGYDLAADSARSADRAKRKHRRLLDQLPAGRYGAWIVERIASNKTTPDLVAIKAIFEQHQLGDVPMRSVAASLKVRRAPAEVVPADVEPVFAAA
jgi:hypothetical protein